MKQFLTLALPLWGIAASHIYEYANLRAEIDKLVATEAIGWAVPVEAFDPRGGPEVWFSTDIGNDRVKIGPWSELAMGSLIRLSRDPNNQMVMKVLKPDSQPTGIGEWPVPDETPDWETTTPLVLGSKIVDQSMNEIRFDFRRNDIEFTSVPISFFRDAWDLELVALHKSRLLVSCAELQRKGSERFTMNVGGVSIRIDEVADADPELSGFRDMGMCPLNVLLNAVRPTIGRTILEQYDLILDGFNSRIVILPKSAVTPTRPLMKYRLDPEFSIDPTCGSWRWIPSPGRANQEDFVFSRIDKDSARFELICLAKSCGQHVLPSKGKLWVGGPTIEFDSTGAVTVRETRGWERFAIALAEQFQTVSIRIERKGYRMKRNPETTLRGLRMEFVPVDGPKEVGEFSIAEWPPVFSGRTVEIAHINVEDVYALIAGIDIWNGVPKFEVIDGNRILVSAEISENTCDRALSVIVSSQGSMVLDFSIEICDYRQEDLGELGYLFKHMSRSETRSSAPLRIILKQGAVDFEQHGELYLFSLSQPDNVWSPDVRWLAAPELTIDSETRDIFIRPSGEPGWEYSHEWEKGRESASSRLVFKVLPKKLIAPPTLLLTDGLWEFTPATTNTQGSSFTIVKDRWLIIGMTGEITLLFEEIEGLIFQGANTATYVGIPEIKFDEAGSLIVRSNGDQRYLFEVQARISNQGNLAIVFIATDFTAVGSVPVEAEADDDKCPICFDEYTPGEQLAETRCKHRFHLDCLRRVEGRKCPLCRTSFDLVNNP